MEWKDLLCHIGFLMLMNMVQNKAFVLGVGLIQNEFWFTCTLFWYKSQFCSSNNGRNSGLNFSTDDYNKEKSAIFTSVGDIFVNCLAVSFSQTVLFALVLRWFSHVRWKKHPLATRVKNLWFPNDWTEFSCYWMHVVVVTDLLLRDWACTSFCELPSFNVSFCGR